MKISIKNQYSDEVLLEGEAENLKEFIKINKANLSGADLSGADLSGADLSGANLCGADLCEADLSGANLCGAKIKISQKEELIKALGIIIEE